MSRRPTIEKSAGQKRGADALMEAVGFRIRALREAQGLTQHALSKRAALSRSSIANIEGARHNFTAKQIAAIADALGVAVVALFHD